ncbi:hypothetical protein [Legionella micdadei]|uniref:General stress protein 17M-like domain-containing protein n=1 Tax=Legionella micdadei TaxID=451 RepID=A0A098GIL3_LEGMI|nr:hypothetical protein [Legionella micdadei]ARG98717.1 hypothetical protein B6N58_14205 [Legionella micdadei]ARH01436.1 hypothetical protein B6V88_14075 [Legionella micdadei]KTD28932.1 hypothetical protein Lmic_0852 [Legionella micdadei]CEG62313.1 conserved protein of unknown function [Legionella micdadei]SCY03892.1 hypothetical protein SAMN02982997_00681 [Legionella micdadei]
MVKKSNSPILTEIFYDKKSAEKAYQDAINRGYNIKEINVLMSEHTRKKYYQTPPGQQIFSDNLIEDAAIGGSLGGIIGGTIGAIAGLGATTLLPGLGVVVGGPMVAALAGAGAGGISGGLFGAMVGWGFTEEQAKIYEKGIKSGGIVLGVNKKNKNFSLLESDWRNIERRKEKERSKR